MDRSYGARVAQVSWKALFFHRRIVSFEPVPWTNDNKKPAISNGFCTLMDCIGLLNGEAVSIELIR